LHWRAEPYHQVVTYVNCAQRIIQTKNNILDYMDVVDIMEVDDDNSIEYDNPNSSNNNNNGRPVFFLTSSLSQDEQNSWNGARVAAQNTTAQQALDLLLSDPTGDGEDTPAQFLKLDTLLPKQNDSIYYVVYDLILIQKAQVFTTCVEQCLPKRIHEFCRQCNWIGNFAQLAIDLRLEYTDTTTTTTTTTTAAAYYTLPCWPETVPQVQEIDQSISKTRIGNN
jgi:hypothetical protein